jgi:hypothetical protein
MRYSSEEEAAERATIPMEEVGWALRAVQRLDAPVRATMARRHPRS